MVINVLVGVDSWQDKIFLCRGIASRRHLGTVFSCLMCPLRGSLSANGPSKERFYPAGVRKAISSKCPYFLTDSENIA